MVNTIYSKLLQLNKTYTEAPFLDLSWSISNDIVSTKIYDKQDDFDVDYKFSIVGWRRPSCYILWCIIIYLS